MIIYIVSIRCVCKEGFKLGNDNITCEPAEDDDNKADEVSARGEIIAEPAYRPKPEIRYNIYQKKPLCDDLLITFSFLSSIMLYICYIVLDLDPLPSDLWCNCFQSSLLFIIYSSFCGIFIQNIIIIKIITSL